MQFAARSGLPVVSRRSVALQQADGEPVLHGRLSFPRCWRRVFHFGRPHRVSSIGLRSYQAVHPNPRGRRPGWPLHGAGPVPQQGVGLRQADGELSVWFPHAGALLIVFPKLLPGLVLLAAEDQIVDATQPHDVRIAVGKAATAWNFHGPGRGSPDRKEARPRHSVGARAVPGSWPRNTGPHPCRGR